MYEINPLTDARWVRFIERHSMASVFHSPEWLESLNRTYGYAAAALTTSPPNEELRHALAFCRVESWLTGRRLVSIPFSDHCAPLVDCGEHLRDMLAHLRNECAGRRGRYVEIRPVSGLATFAENFSESARFYLHKLDLRPSLDELFHGLHANCIRRKVSRAIRESFAYEEGQSEALLHNFYQLAVVTRRRQHLPPQPLAWFRNLIACLKDRLKIRMLFHQGEPAAAILTLRFQRTMTYKYGCSDRKFHRLGAMQLLLWKAIEEAKNDGLVEFDMGRSDVTNDGLTQFKDRWGCSRSAIVYLRYPTPKRAPETSRLPMYIARQLLTLAPNAFLKTAGQILYRHMA